MSELINNKRHRQEVLKSLIKQLHDGKTVDDVKAEFAASFEGVSAHEISQAEQALIAEGMPVAEIQRLCDVHAAVFKGSIEEIHATDQNSFSATHPLEVFKDENRALEQVIEQELLPALKKWQQEGNAETLAQLEQAVDRLATIDLHYIKKENVFFPYMESYGITAPPKVMWGVDDEIREQIKLVKAGLGAELKDKAQISEQVEKAVHSIKEMIFKEEEIMMPMLVENLTPAQWQQVAADFGDIGYCLIEAVPTWQAPGEDMQDKADLLPDISAVSDEITLPSGKFTVEELTKVLDALPFDITFVDKNDRVRYFSQSEERIFPRSVSIIGREVANCHPPKSVHVVEAIVEDFKSSKKDHEDFWIQTGDAFILIRYFAVRDDQGAYMGTVEVTQNIKPIQEIRGEKRLMDK